MTYTHFHFTPSRPKPASEPLHIILLSGFFGLLGLGFLFYELAQAVAWLGSQVVRP